MANDKKQLVIAVTGLNATDNPGSGLGVIRALRDAFADLRIIGLSYESLEPGIYMHDLVDKTYQLPYPTAGSAALTERLLFIHEVEGIQVIIPNFDSELYNFIKIVPWLKAAGIRTFLPTMEQLDCRDKLNLYKFGQKNGLKVPEDRIVYKADEITKAVADLGFPMVVKGKYYDASVEQTLEQAQKAFYKLSARWGLPVIAQRFIKGTEINIAGLGDGSGGIISMVPMRKLYITEKGKAWAGITIEDEDLLTLANDFVKATKWQGAFELEVMREGSGALFIMEINPRFPAWIYLAAGAGQNQPAALVQMAMGESIKPFAGYNVGKMFIRYSWDHLVDIAEFQQISGFGEL